MELVTYKMKRGDFGIWMEELVASLAPVSAKVVIVCDNTPAHSRAEEHLAATVTKIYGESCPFENEVF